MKVKKIDINKLQPASYNPRQISTKQYKDLKESVNRFGVVDPIIINKDMTVIGGHQRLKVCKDLKHTEIDCVVLDLTKEEERELNIRLNKSGGEFDMDILANEFDVEELKDWGFKDIEFGFNIDKIVEGNTEDDHIPEVKESRVKLGDVWELGKHRLMCGDSTKESDVEKLMNGKKGELLFTSPPYSDMRDYNGSKDLSVNNLIEFIPTFLPYAEYQVINLGIQRKDNEIVQYWDNYINKAKECGYKFLSWCIWNRNEPRTLSQQKAFIPIAHEWVFVFGKKTKEINKTKECKSAGKKNKGNFIPSTINGEKNTNGKRVDREYFTNSHKKINTVNSIGVANSGEHPAMFPVELPVEYIEAITNTNNIIVDCFLGSGTTLIACEKTNRICYGMELDTKYCDVIIERWEQFTGQKANKCG
jgi:DNA modification methylase